MSGEVIDKVACPKCRETGGDSSGDNLVVYDDNWGTCFACGHREKVGGEPSMKTETIKTTPSNFLAYEYKPLVNRRITEETCKKFNYGVASFKGKTVQVAHYYEPGSKSAVYQKLRTKDKDFPKIGNAKAKACLFGEPLWAPGGKMLVVTEGEIDAMTVSQLYDHRYPVVSVRDGAGSAVGDFRNRVEFLESFEKVIIMFDQDEPGQEAAAAAAAILSPGKAYIATLPFKDANECLLNGKGKDVLDAVWKAKPYQIDGVVDGTDLIEEALEDIERGLPWPWPSLTEKTYGRRRGELYGFGGGTGCGKSTIFKQVGVHILQNEPEANIGLIMLEERPSLTLRTMAGMVMGARTNVPTEELDRTALRDAMGKIAKRCMFYNHFGAKDWESIKSRIRFMVVGMGCKDIFLDHLTAVAATMELDERKALDKLMAEMSGLAQELNCTIYYVSHLTTPEGVPHEEGGRVMEKHFRGSRSIAFWTHFLFGIERDKQDLDGVTTFRVLKDRFTGDSNGVTFGLAYNKVTGHLDECALPIKETKKSSSHGFSGGYDDDF
jgi:twinkle protein|tara:strand:- start:27112 stop:28761 length:1650 start_codon:yes stop_codon:yes gene_type:complete